MPPPLRPARQDFASQQLVAVERIALRQWHGVVTSDSSGVSDSSQSEVQARR